MTTPRKRRPGGGRKRIAGGTVRKTITLTLEDAEYLAALDASTTRAVRLLVQRDRELAGLAEDERLSRYYDWYYTVGIGGE